MAVIIILGAKLYREDKISIGDITSFLLQMMQLLLNFVMLASVFSTVMTVFLKSLNLFRYLEPHSKLFRSSTMFLGWM